MTGIQLTLAINRICTSFRVISRVTSVLDSQVSCIVLGTLKDNYDMSASAFVVQFNGFMSLTSLFDVKYRY